MSLSTARFNDGDLIDCHSPKRLLRSAVRISLRVWVTDSVGKMVACVG